MDYHCHVILESLNLENVTIIQLNDFENDDLLLVKQQRTIAEYCWTCTASSIWYSIQTYGLDHCTYLDADMQFFSSPEPIFIEIGSKSVGITRHDFSPNLQSSEIYGKYCVQFTYFKNDIDGLKALDWWKNKCIEWCYAKLEDEKYGDQKYLDQFESKFDNVVVISNPGAGVAPWNISKYQISSIGNRTVISPILEPTKIFDLIFYHYQGLKFKEKSNEIELVASIIRIDDIPIKYIYEPYINLLLATKNHIENIPFEIKKIKIIDKLPIQIFSRLKIILKHYSSIRTLYYLFRKSRYNQPKQIGGKLNIVFNRSILQINTVINSGSTGRISEYIGRSALNKQWNSYIAFGRGHRPSNSELLKIGSRFHPFWHAILTRLFDRHGLSSKIATTKLVEKIKQIKPDIILLHNIHGYYINIEILFNFLKTYKVPVVWTLYDTWAFTGHCCYFERIGCSKWIHGCYSCPLTHEYPSSWFIDRSKQNYLEKKKIFNELVNLTLVVHSKWLAHNVAKSFLQRIPLKIINNGIDLTLFSPRANPLFREKYLIQNKFIILGVANDWNKRKGLPDFIELSKLVDNNTVIILLGLTRLQRYKVPSNILGLAKTESINDLAEIYSSADVFINPSWDDNFPTTNLESLACGTPVITYNTGGSIEAITNDTGIIVEKGNFSELLNAINTIKLNGKTYYSNACRKRCEQFYNQQDRYADYLMLCETLLQR